MIELRNVSKIYEAGGRRVEALKGVSLRVERGEIFGVIGYSGAGKSTLARCINLLERPTSGQVIVGGQDLTSLSSQDLRKARRKIGMIFQGFHLLRTATVYENVAIPLRLSGLARSDTARRVKRYLEVVGLSDKRDAYPAQLSGGQKQRVAIARALAHEPEVLLSDEATSALDPDTTDAILQLLAGINREFGITILLITHEMGVIRRICNRVAVMEAGKIIESGSTLQIFHSPVNPTTRKFVDSVFHDALPESLLARLRESGPIVALSFAGWSSAEPLLAEVSKRYDVYPNILSGQITQLKDGPVGKLTVHFRGDPAEIRKAVSDLVARGIRVEGEIEHVAESVSRAMG